MQTSEHYSGTKTLYFDDERHRYELDGKYVPGVTTILSGGLAESPEGLLTWASNIAVKFILDNVDSDKLGDEVYRKDLARRALHERKNVLNSSADLGTLVHKKAEEHCLSRLGKCDDPVAPENEKAARCYQQFLKWMADAEVEVISTESKVLSLEWWFAGTVDLDCHVKGKRCLVDFKTSKAPYEKYRYQLSAYALALREEFGTRYEQRICAVFPRTGGPFKAESYTEHDLDEAIFLTARQQVALRSYQRQYKDHLLEAVRP